MPSPRTNGLGLRSNFCRGHFWVHSRYGPVTHSPPQGGFVGWLHPLRFLHECNPSYGGLAFTPVGLSPTEHASLCWTHSFAKTASAAMSLRCNAFITVMETDQLRDCEDPADARNLSREWTLIGRFEQFALQQFTD